MYQSSDQELADELSDLFQTIYVDAGWPEDLNERRLISRPGSDAAGGKGGNAHGALEMDTLLFLRGDFFPVESNGFIKLTAPVGSTDAKKTHLLYNKMWEDHDYSTLPADNLKEMLPKFQEIIGLRQKELNQHADDTGARARIMREAHQEVLDMFVRMKAKVQNLVAKNEKLKQENPSEFQKQQLANQQKFIEKLVVVEKKQDQRVEELKKGGQVPSKAFKDRQVNVKKVVSAVKEAAPETGKAGEIKATSTKSGESQAATTTKGSSTAGQSTRSQARATPTTTNARVKTTPTADLFRPHRTEYVAPVFARKSDNARVVPTNNNTRVTPVRAPTPAADPFRPRGMPTTTNTRVETAPVRALIPAADLFRPRSTEYVAPVSAPKSDNPYVNLNNGDLDNYSGDEYFMRRALKNLAAKGCNMTSEDRDAVKMAIDHDSTYADFMRGYGIDPNNLSAPPRDPKHLHSQTQPYRYADQQPHSRPQQYFPPPQQYTPPPQQQQHFPPPQQYTPPPPQQYFPPPQQYFPPPPQQYFPPPPQYFPPPQQYFPPPPQYFPPPPHYPQHVFGVPSTVGMSHSSHSRAGSTWDHFRSNVWTGGSQSEMSAAYKNWKQSK